MSEDITPLLVPGSVKPLPGENAAAGVSPAIVPLATTDKINAKHGCLIANS